MPPGLFGAKHLSQDLLESGKYLCISIYLSRSSFQNFIVGIANAVELAMNL